MTREQRTTVDLLLSQGFKITEDIERGTRMSRGSDLRVVKTDGSQRRAQHKGREYEGVK